MRSSSSEHATLHFCINGWPTPLVLVVLHHSALERLIKDINLCIFELASTDSALEEKVELGKSAAAGFGNAEEGVYDAQEADASPEKTGEIAPVPRSGVYHIWR